MSNEKQFPSGLYFKLPNGNAPGFVKGKVNIKVDDFKKYLNRVQGEWLNIDLKVSKDGKAYAEIDTWKPDSNRSEKRNSSTSEVSDGFDDMSDDLPF